MRAELLNCAILLNNIKAGGRLIQRMIGVTRALWIGASGLAIRLWGLGVDIAVDVTTFLPVDCGGVSIG